jgi:hypothetical protein
MKKILMSLAFVLITVALAFGAGTLTPTDIPTTTLTNAGYVVTVTATADSAAATYPPLLFADSTSYYQSMFRTMRGKWLTSARTTPSLTTPPTANYDIYIVDGVSATSDFVLNSATLAIGTTNTAVSTVAFTFVVNGVSYAKAAVAAGTAPGDDVIVATKYGAVAFDIGANGTIDAVEATDQAAAEFTTAALAVAALPACASDHVRLGYVTATKSDGAFTFGTTALNAVNSTVAYTSSVPQYDIMGGRLVNRSATVAEEVFPANTAGDNSYIFMKRPIMVVPVNNSVNSAVFTLELNFN